MVRFGLGEHETYYYPTNQKLNQIQGARPLYKFKIQVGQEYMIDPMNFQSL